LTPPCNLIVHDQFDVWIIRYLVPFSSHRNADIKKSKNGLLCSNFHLTPPCANQLVVHPLQ
jgi:hypothetical protein